MKLLKLGWPDIGYGVTVGALLGYIVAWFIIQAPEIINTTRADWHALTWWAR